MAPTRRTVRDAMTRCVVCVDPALSVAEALDLAREHFVTHLPVVARDRAIGLVCTCDLEEASLSADVSSVMHAPPVQVDPDRALTDAAMLMAKLCIGSVLVVADEHLVGILTRSDLVLEGLAEAAFGDQKCTACGTLQHVHHDAARGLWLCASCRRRSIRPRDERELGNPG